MDVHLSLSLSEMPDPLEPQQQHPFLEEEDASLSSSSPSSSGGMGAWQPAAMAAPAQQSGSVQAIMGPMFSGKSTELLRRVRRYTFARKECCVIKYAKDRRYAGDDLMATHDRLTWAALAAEKLSDVVGNAVSVAGSDFSSPDGVGSLEKLDMVALQREMNPVVWTADVVGIDEGQFFEDLVPVCELLANLGKIVIVACLDGTFQRRPFESTVGLISIAESICKLSAVCMGCYRPAAFSKRLGNETAIEVIGGADMYVAVCRECYHDPHNHNIRNPDDALAAKKTRPNTPPAQVKGVVGMPGSPPAIQS